MSGVRPFCCLVGSLVVATIGVSCDRAAPRGASTGTAASTKTADRSAPNSDLKGRDVIFTSLYPAAYFATRIAGGKLPVRCPVPEDADPIFWQPTPSQITEYQEAGLIVLNGAEYDKWVSTVALPMNRVVDSSRVFEAEFVRFPDVTHSHGAAGAHSHQGIDGHTWMDPVLASRQAEQIRQAMERRWPAHSESFRAGLAALAGDLAALDARLRSLAPALKSVRLICSHPAYGYLAKRHGLVIPAVDLSPDAMPPERAWTALNAALTPSDRRPVVLLFESEPLPAIRERLATLGVWPVVFSPCETLDAASAARGDDYLTIMNRNIDSLAAALPSISAESHSN